MKNYNLELLREKITYIRYGILKVSGKSFARLSNILVDTVKADDKGFIWCRIPEEMPALLFSNNKEFKVNMRYVHKDDGLFIRLDGDASIECDAHDNKMMLKIKIISADFFRKETLSHYTSVLQSVFNFSVKNLIPRQEKISA